MKNMTLPDITRAVEGKLYINGSETDIKEDALSSDSVLNKEAEGVVIDSRLCGKDQIFVAVKGERADGHDFLEKVMENGALGAICEKLPEDYFTKKTDGAFILVEDSLKALKDLAAYYRKQVNAKIVGIVGSVGKTSTKELVASVLSESFNTCKTEGNFNNEIGVPLTIFRIRAEHEMAVVEMGISDFGEMDRLGNIVKPDVVVMTNIGPCHLEKLLNLEGVLKAKSEVLKHIQENGLLILNTDDENLRFLYDSHRMMYRNSCISDKAFLEKKRESLGEDFVGYAEKALSRIKTAGYGTEGDASGFDVQNKGVEGSVFKIKIRKGLLSEEDLIIPAKVNMQGSHMVMNALAASIAGLYMGMSPEKISSGLGAAMPVKGRCCPNYTDRFLVVDDSYNANPKSMMAAADLLDESDGRKVMIMGDMFELGEDEKKLHYEVGEYIARKNIDLAVFVGELSKNAYEGCKKVLESEGTQNQKAVPLYFPTREELLEKLNSIGLKEHDTILVKASHGMGFAEVVERLIDLGTKFRFVKGREKMRIDDIMGLLAQTHWACKRSRETVEKAIENSLCFGIIDEEGKQVAFGRTVTDYATMFYVSDVVIDKDHQKMGLGSRFVKFIKSAPELEDLWGFLGTTKASGFYSRFGFEKKDDFFMAMPKTNKKGIFNV